MHIKARDKIRDDLMDYMKENPFFYMYHIEADLGQYENYNNLYMSSLVNIYLRYKEAGKLIMAHEATLLYDTMKKFLDYNCAEHDRIMGK